MKKGKTVRRNKQEQIEGYNFQKNVENDEPFGMVREGGDGQASPDNEWPDISDDGNLPLTLHSVPVGGDKSGNDLGGITDRIAKLLHEYESVYDDDTAQKYAGASVAGQIYMDNLLGDYRALCKEREEILESLHDSLDLDEDEILDRLERMSKKSAEDIEGSAGVVKETFEHAKKTFQRLNALNKEMLDLTRQGQDTSKIEEEKNRLQEELIVYKRMAVQQKLDATQKTRRKSMIKKDESQQWKLVAREMIDIVKSIKLEGRTDKVQLEKDLNMIIMAMAGLNEQIDRLKGELAASDSNVKKLQEEKTNLHREKSTNEEEIKDKLLEVKQLRMVIKKLEEEKKEQAEKKLAEKQEAEKAKAKDKAKALEVVEEVMQAQLRDQKNKVAKLEEQNKELVERLESYEQAEYKKKETEMNLGQFGATDCSNCQLLGQEVLTSREEISVLESKIEELLQQLAGLKDQLELAQEDLESVMESRTSEGMMVDEGEEASSPTPSPTSEVSPEFQEIPAESPEEASSTVTTKPVPKSKPRRIGLVKKKITKRLKKSDGTSIKEERLEELHSEYDKNKTKDQIRTEEIKKEQMKAEKDWIKEEIIQIKTSKEQISEVKTRKEEKRVEETKKETTQVEDNKSKDEETGEHVEENSPYVEIREAKMVTLCNMGAQTDYHGRLINMLHGRRDTIASWKASKKDRRHSLTDAIMSNAPPTVIEQETSIATSVINEEVDRLCEDICGFMEYGYDLLEQEEKLLQTQVANIGEKDAQNITALKEDYFHDIPSGAGRRQSIIGSHPQAFNADTLFTTDRRQSLSGGNFFATERRHSLVGGSFITDRRQSVVASTSFASDRRQSLVGETRQQSAILQLDTQRRSSQYQHVVGKPELYGRQVAEPLSEEVDETGIEEEAQGLVDLRSIKGEGGRKLLGEYEMKKKMASMGQYAINIIRDTGEALSCKLNEKLGFYEKFYDYWRQSRKARRPSIGRGPMAGKRVIYSELDRPVKSRGGYEEDLESDTGGLLPSIGTSADQGFMLIGSVAKSEPPPKTITPKPTIAPKKRGKPRVMTRQQQMMKQKALIDKAMHRKETNILTIEATGPQRSSSPQRTGGQQYKPSPSVKQPSFNLPFIAHGISKTDEQFDKRKTNSIQRRLSVVEDLQKPFSLWNKKQVGIQKFYSSNDVPLVKGEVRTSTKRKTNKNKLPTLDIGNLFKTL